MTDRYTADTINSDALDDLYETNRRLNYRAQQLESELAAYRRAVAQWEINEHRTYVPLRTLAVIAKAAGRNIETPQWLLHYQRVEQAEAAVARVRALAEERQAEAEDGTLTDADTLWPSEILTAIESPTKDTTP